MKDLLQNSATIPITFLMVSASDHVTPITGLAPSVLIFKSGGGGWNFPAGAVTEIGNGWYQIAANAGDRDTLGPLLIHATGTGADPTDDRYWIVAFNPFDSAALGLTRLDAAVSSRSTYAGADTPGTATLLARVPSALTITGGKVDVNDKTGFSLATAPPTSAQISIDVWAAGSRALTDKGNFTLASAYDAAKTAGDATSTKQDAILAAIPSVASIVTGVWGAAARTLTGFGTLVADVWGAAVRSLTDKANYSLTAAYDAAVNAAQPSDIPTPPEIADQILVRNLGGGSDGGRTVADALRAVRNRVTITPLTTSTATLTVYQENDTTIAWSGVVQLDGAALPITALDPS